MRSFIADQRTNFVLNSGGTCTCAQLAAAKPSNGWFGPNEFVRGVRPDELSKAMPVNENIERPHVTF